VDLVNDVGEVKTEGDDSAEASSSDSSDSDMDQDTASADPELLDFRRKVRDVTGMIKGDATAHAAPATGSHIASWEVHTKGMCKGKHWLNDITTSHFWVVSDSRMLMS